jgi:hypothetical protein
MAQGIARTLFPTEERIEQSKRVTQSFAEAQRNNFQPTEKEISQLEKALPGKISSPSNEDSTQTKSKTGTLWGQAKEYFQKKLKPRQKETKPISTSSEDPSFTEQVNVYKRFNSIQSKGPEAEALREQLIKDLNAGSAFRKTLLGNIKLLESALLGATDAATWAFDPKNNASEHFEKHKTILNKLLYICLMNKNLKINESIIESGQEIAKKKLEKKRL